MSRPEKDDPFDLARFASVQEAVYDNALAEIRSGEKRSHWMWFIFPQIDGLGFSATAKHYAIKSLEEARQYLAHPVLGARLGANVPKPFLPWRADLPSKSSVHRMT